MKKILAGFIFTLMLGLLLSACVAAFLWQWLHREMTVPEHLAYVSVQKGDTLHAIAREFAEAGLIEYPRAWVWYARVAGLAQVKVGEYALPGQASPLQLLRVLDEGKVIQYQVTLVEGNRFVDYVAKLHAEAKLKKTFELNQALNALADAGLRLDHPEGWFFPDTYRYSAGDTDMSVLLRAHEKMKQVLDREWLLRDRSVPYRNAYEALIMASIVEKETGVPGERGEIAGVFTRRLMRGMRLQTDPTVIYGMGEAYSGNITRRDLRTRTAYNTYLIDGLPPTPIANPGIEAIRATLNPSDGESLYFVARGDGSHHFSATLEEHNRAVQQYQKRRRQDYRSAPAPSTEEATP